MKLPAASTKRTGQPRWAQRLETATNVLGVLVELLGALADVGGGLAGVADSLGFGEDDLAVGVLDEVADRADRLPALLAAVEDRGDGEADGGQDDRGAGDPAEPLGGDREGATASHRLALEVAGRVGLLPLLPGSLLGPVLLVRVVSHVASSQRIGSAVYCLGALADVVSRRQLATARIGLGGHGDYGEAVIRRQGSRPNEDRAAAVRSLFVSAAAALLVLALGAPPRRSRRDLARPDPRKLRRPGRADLQDEHQGQRTDPRRGPQRRSREGKLEVAAGQFTQGRRRFRQGREADQGGAAAGRRRGQADQVDWATSKTETKLLGEIGKALKAEQQEARRRPSRSSSPTTATSPTTPCSASTSTTA